MRKNQCAQYIAELAEQRRRGIFVKYYIMFIMISLLWLNIASANTVTIPAGVIMIKEEAFYGDTSLDEVVIPEGCVSIGPRAFAWSSVKSVTLPDSLESIADDAFDHHVSMTAYGYQNSYAQTWCQKHSIPFVSLSTPFEDFTVEYISSSDNPETYSGVRITDWNGSNGRVIIPSVWNNDLPVVEIDAWAFEQKENLLSVYIPDSVTKIGESAFYECGSLVSVRLPIQLSTLESGVFIKCSSLVTVNIPASLERIPDWTFIDCTSLTKVVFPDTLRDIGDGAFSGCSSLKKVEFPDTLQSIGRYAFWMCSSLSEVSFSHGLISISEGAFLQCNAMKYASLPDSMQMLGRDAFSECAELERIHYPKSLQECNSEGCFADCPKLKIVTFSEGTSRIASSFLTNCASLEQIDLPDTITAIEYGAFRNCTGLRQIDLPTGLTTLGAESFSGCINLENVIFHEGLKEIRDKAFFNCSSLKTADLPDSVEMLGPYEYVFFQCSSLERIHYPKNLKQIAKYGTFIFCDNIKEITFTEGTERIIEYAFMDLKGLKEVDIPDSVQYIEKGAFCGCLNLERIYIPTGTVIDEINNPGVFGDARNLCIWCEYGSPAHVYAQKYGINYYYLTLTDAVIPEGTVYQYKIPRTKGMVRSTLPITVTAEIRDSNRILKAYKEFDFESNEFPLNESFAVSVFFYTLPLGNYSFTLTASTEKSEELMAVTDFAVVEEPLRGRLIDSSLRSHTMFYGSTERLNGTVEGTYIMNKVEVIITPFGGTPQVIAEATPYAKQYDLVNMNCNFSRLSAGKYTVEIYIYGHGESARVAMFCLNVMDQNDNGFGNVNMNTMKWFVSTGDYYFVSTYGSAMDTISMQVTEGVGWYTGGTLFLSNVKDYASKVLEKMISLSHLNFGTGGINEEFLVELCEQEIIAFMHDLNGDFNLYQYDKSFGEKVLGFALKGDYLTSEMLKLEDGTPRIPDTDLEKFVNNWNSTAKLHKDMYKVISISEHTYEVMKNALTDYSAYLTILSSLKNNSAQLGQMGTYYQQAINNIEEKYQRDALTAISNVLTAVLEDAQGNLQGEIVSGALRTLSNYVSFGSLLIDVLDFAGAYDGADTYLQFMMEMQSYYNAEKNFEELLLRVRELEFSEEIARQVYNQFDIVVHAGIRALETLSENAYPFMSELDTTLLSSTLLKLKTEKWPFIW